MGRPAGRREEDGCPAAGDERRRDGRGVRRPRREPVARAAGTRLHAPDAQPGRDGRHRRSIGDHALRFPRRRHHPRQEHDDGHAHRPAHPRRGDRALRAGRRRARFDAPPVPGRPVRQQDRRPGGARPAGHLRRGRVLRPGRHRPAARRRDRHRSVRDRPPRRRRGLARIARRGGAPLPHRGGRAQHLARRRVADQVQAAQRRRRAGQAAHQAPAPGGRAHEALPGGHRRQRRHGDRAGPGRGRRPHHQRARARRAAADDAQPGLAVAAGRRRGQGLRRRSRGPIR